MINFDEDEKLSKTGEGIASNEIGEKITEAHRIKIIRNFFDDEFKDIEKDKLSQAYMFTNFAKGDLQKLLERLPKDTILNLDDLRIMFEAYCIEYSNKKNGFVLEALIAPILTGLCSGLAVLFFQQSILESRGTVKPEDMTAVIECIKKQLNGKGYSELESLCSPLNNKFFQRADNETYNAIGKIIREDKWDSRKGYRGEDIANKRMMCPKLKEIDRLWKDASGGKLGFNVQRKIWNKTKSYSAFTKDVGWKNDDGSWTIPSYDLEKVKNGHLPTLWTQTNGNPSVGNGSGEKDYKIFFEFIESCDLEKD